jgi:hypothetical protein
MTGTPFEMVIVMIVAGPAAPLLALAETLVGPAVVGVPEIRPDAAFRERPAGRGVAA